VKVIGRLPGERSCLSLVWAVLDRASRGWRGVVMTPSRRAPAPGAAPPAPPPVTTRGGGQRDCHPCRLTCVIGSPRQPLFHLKRDATGTWFLSTACC